MKRAALRAQLPGATAARLANANAVACVITGQIGADNISLVPTLPSIHRQRRTVADAGGHLGKT